MRVLCLKYCVFSCRWEGCPSSPIRRVIGQNRRRSAKFFQNIFHRVHTAVDIVPDGVLRNILGFGDVGLTPAQDVVTIDPAGLDRRRLVESGVEGVPLLGLLHDLLRGQRGPG